MADACVPGKPHPPLCAWAQAATWQELRARRWVFRESIHFGELGAVLEWVKALPWIAELHDTEVCALSGNAIVVGAVAKGRSSCWRLNSRLQRLAAFLLVVGVRLFVLWVPSALQPGDGPSRRRGR